ncbi:MAG: choline kinase [Gammaproteobacteria bacterium]|jgi:choline kinase
MKVIILAAGQGTRLRPYTDDRPKCMVELGGVPMLHRQLDVLRSCGIADADIALIGGYCQDRLIAEGIRQFTNPRFDKTNMVGTLFCAETFMEPGQDLLICYGDIVYERQVLEATLQQEGEMVLAADREWRRLWSLRMEEPLDDAETFKMAQGRVIELGKKPRGYDEVEAQYMGLIRISGPKVQDFIDAYHALDECATYDGKDFDNMYMTSLIQVLIDAGWAVCPALVDNGWIEVDSASELEQYEALHRQGKLDDYVRLD